MYNISSDFPTCAMEMCVKEFKSIITFSTQINLSYDMVDQWLALTPHRFDSCPGLFLCRVYVHVLRLRDWNKRKKKKKNGWMK